MANQNQGGQSQSDRGGNQGGQAGGRGFAGMSDQEQSRVAQKGGEAVSKDREHMADIGRKGGEASGGSQGASERSQSVSSRSSDRDEQGSRGSDERGASRSEGSSGETGSGGRNN